MILRLMSPCRFDFVLALALLGAMTGWPIVREAVGDEPKAAEPPSPPAVSHAEAVPAPAMNMPSELAPATAPSVAAPPAAEPVPTAIPASPAASNLAPPLPPSVALPPAEPVEATVPSGKNNEGLTFNFRYQPWEDVLNWFAKQAGFSLVMNAPPAGTFNYSDDRSYTPAEAIDLLNGVLLTKGYTLVLRDRMLMLINLEDGIPPNLVSTVTIDQLDQRGEFELVSTLFQLENLRPEEAELEIKKLIGPQGAVVVLPKAQQLLVTETAGRLRTIREVIQRADNPAVAGPEQVQKFSISSSSPEEILGILRQMFNIPVGQNATADGTIRLAWDPASMQLLVAAPPAKMEQISKILQALSPAGGDASVSAGMQAAPQLEVYEVYPADPESALKVLQTLLAGTAGVRLTTDPKTGSLVALARPSEHATIRATLEQMQRDALQVEVLRLRIADPQTAAQSIQKLFGTDGKAPSVQADVVTRQLLVRGSEAQLEQIRSILKQMGETDLIRQGTESGGNVRMIPITGPTARSALERLEEIWPTMHQNQIRIVTPSAVIPTLRPSSSAEESSRLSPRESRPPAPMTPPPPPAPTAPSQTPVEPAATTTATSPWVPVLLVSDVPEAKATSPASPPTSAPTAKPASPIIVAPGPGGVVIASDDVQALDEFESLLKTLVGSASSGGSNMTIFYLKHAKANSVAETLDRVLGGGTLPREYYEAQQRQQQQQQQQQGGPPGMTVFPGGRGMRGGPEMSAAANIPAQNPTLRITPDSRLNALIVRAGPVDLELIEELLKILDQLESPEDILAQPKPRLVPVYNTQADEIVEVLKEVYADRVGASSSSGSGGPSPFMMMFGGMRGSRGRTGGQTSSSRSTEETQKMSLGVDTRTNAVIVSAPEPLFTEVKQLIEQLDTAAVDSNETMRVVTLQKASLTAVEEALASLMGESVQVSRTTSNSSSMVPPQSSTTRQRSTRPYQPQSRTSTGRSGTTRQMPRQMSGSRNDSSTSRSYRPSR